GLPKIFGECRRRCSAALGAERKGKSRNSSQHDERTGRAATEDPKAELHGFIPVLSSQIKYTPAKATTPDQLLTTVAGHDDLDVEFKRLEGSRRVRGKSPTHLRVSSPVIRAMTSCSLIADPRRLHGGVMTRTMTSRPNLEHFRGQAKTLLDDLRSG